MRSFRARTAFGIKLGLSPAKARILARLKTPSQVQDFVNAIPPNFEPNGDTCLSVAEALRQRRAHCIEGAFIAACAFWMHGQKPLLMDFQAHNDDDHVVALFRRNGCWGAISKSNHLWLRWREPIYRSLRELAMSYFHEYLSNGRRTLVTYSVPFDLRRFDSRLWITQKQQCWEMADAIDHIRHFRLVTSAQIRALRKLEPIELRANKLLQYPRPRNLRKNKANIGV